MDVIAERADLLSGCKQIVPGLDVLSLDACTLQQCLVVEQRLGVCKPGHCNHLAVNRDAADCACRIVVHDCIGDTDNCLDRAGLQQLRQPLCLDVRHIRSGAADRGDDQLIEVGGVCLGAVHLNRDVLIGFHKSVCHCGIGRIEFLFRKRPGRPLQGDGLGCGCIGLFGGLTARSAGRIRRHRGILGLAAGCKHAEYHQERKRNREEFRKFHMNLPLSDFTILSSVQSRSFVRSSP